MYKIFLVGFHLMRNCMALAPLRVVQSSGSVRQSSLREQSTSQPPTAISGSLQVTGRAISPVSTAVGVRLASDKTPPLPGPAVVVSSLAPATAVSVHENMIDGVDVSECGASAVCREEAKRFVKEITEGKVSLQCSATASQCTDDTAFFCVVKKLSSQMGGTRRIDRSYDIQLSGRQEKWLKTAEAGLFPMLKHLDDQTGCRVNAMVSRDETFNTQIWTLLPSAATAPGQCTPTVKEVLQQLIASTRAFLPGPTEPFWAQRDDLAALEAAGKDVSKEREFEGKIKFIQKLAKQSRALNIAVILALKVQFEKVKEGAARGYRRIFGSATAEPAVVFETVMSQLKQLNDGRDLAFCEDVRRNSDLVVSVAAAV